MRAMRWEVYDACASEWWTMNAIDQSKIIMSHLLCLHINEWKKSDNRLKKARDVTALCGVVWTLFT